MKQILPLCAIFKSHDITMWEIILYHLKIKVLNLLSMLFFWKKNYNLKWIVVMKNTLLLKMLIFKKKFIEWFCYLLN